MKKVRKTLVKSQEKFLSLTSGLLLYLETWNNLEFEILGKKPGKPGIFNNFYIYSSKLTVLNRIKTLKRYCKFTLNMFLKKKKIDDD